MNAAQNLFEQGHPTELVLDSKHPGINDMTYVTRRNEFFHLARNCRLAGTAVPRIDYTPEEKAIWQHIYEKLAESHEKKACQVYLDAKKILNLQATRLPQLCELDEKLSRDYQIHIVPAEGLLKPRLFFQYLAKRTMPCTPFLRHGADPEYTPEPDIVHDVLGHVPPLINAEYAELMQILGQAVQLASDEQLLAWERIYWFAIEFGLIVEKDDLKVFGSGILSSYGEMSFCFSDKVTHKPFNFAEVTQTDYDPTLMQTTLFYIPSFSYLKKELLKALAELS